MEFTSLVETLRSTTKSTEKVEWLEYYLLSPKDGPYLCYLMQEAFDPKKLHNVVIKKRDIPRPGRSTLGQQKETVKQLFELLPKENSHAVNRSRVITAMEVLTREDQEALMGIVNKKLRCGVGIKQINKVVEDLIPVQEIQLAKKYEPKKNYPAKWWYVSPKMDGQRVFAIKHNNKPWKLFSRDHEYLGREITTLEHWKPELDRLHEKVGVTFVDGEAYQHGLKFEDIQSLVSSRVNVKSTIDIQYNIFYMGRPEGNDLKSKVLLGVPPDSIYKVFHVSNTDSDDLKWNYLVGIRQEKIADNVDTIYEKLEEAVEDGYEGIILRSDELWYDFKRSDALLKVKTSHKSGTEQEVDCYVEDMEYGDFMVREDGVESSEYLPIALLVVMNDDETTQQMKVGSGFSLEDRRAWKRREELIVGKTIEVRCQGFGSHGRMRFPRYLRTREDV